MTTIPLSEALRLGSMATEQAFDEMYVLNEHREVAQACALGALLLALGAVEDQRLRAPAPQCPVCQVVQPTWCPLSARIMHLNDFHRWTRERIADWLAEIEQQRAKTPSCLEPQDCHTVTPVLAQGDGHDL